MGEDIIIQLGQDTLKTAAMIAGPLLIGTLVIGLIVSFLQAITQINEATLTFIPKMIVVAVVLLIAGTWMMDVMTRFTVGLFENLTEYIR